jgi:hypothetical protein
MSLVVYATTSSGAKKQSKREIVRMNYALPDSLRTAPLDGPPHALSNPGSYTFSTKDTMDISDGCVIELQVEGVVVPLQTFTRADLFQTSRKLTDVERAHVQTEEARKFRCVSDHACQVEGNHVNLTCNVHAFGKGSDKKRALGVVWIRSSALDHIGFRLWKNVATRVYQELEMPNPETIEYLRANSKRKREEAEADQAQADALELQTQEAKKRLVELTAQYAQLEQVAAAAGYKKQTTESPASTPSSAIFPVIPDHAVVIAAAADSSAAAAATSASPSIHSPSTFCIRIA